jgi:molecular chaperone HscB
LHDDPFDLLGLPARFDLDPERVEQEYLRRAAQLHPDRMDDDDATIESSRLNRARDVLRSDEQRADALLQRLGGPRRDSDKSLPQGFLLEIMDAREQANDAMARQDHEAIARSLAWARAQRTGYVARVGALFAVASAPDLLAVRRELNAWRYIERMIEQLAQPHPLS